METIKTGVPLRTAFNNINTNFSTIESDYATQEYVDENGGKIDSISVNGTAQTIDENKNVDLDIPDGVPVVSDDSARGDSSVWVNTSEDLATEDYIPLPTGAEVGDTIMVTAVDENGTPTAWQAVSFPFGTGGDWELVGSVTVTTSGSNVSIQLSKECSALYIVMTIETGTTAREGGEVYFRNSSNTSLFHLKGAFFMSTSGIVYSHILAYKIGGKYWYAQGSGIYSGGSTSQGRAGANAGGIIESDEKVGYVYFTTGSSTAPFTEGTTIEIYGVE